MATAPITEEQPAANDAEAPDLIAIVEQYRGAVLTGKVDPDAYVAALRASVEAKGLTPDTKTGLDQLKSEAYDLRRIKASIDNRGKEMTEHWRKKTAVVNAARKVINEKLDSLIEEVRAPVTKWEEAEKKRKAEADRIIATLEAAKLVRFGETSETVQARLEEIRGMNLNDEVLGPRLEMAEDLKAEVVAELAKAVVDLAAQEAQAAELERLRREKAEADARAEKEAAERLAEQQRIERERAEQERIARAAEEAAETARAEAALEARAAEEERQRQAQAEIDAANARAAEAERAAQAERDRIAAEQRAREEAEAAAAEAQRKREADLAHRQQVIDAAVDALAGDSGIPGLTRKLATSIIHAIEAGKVPAVSIKF
ncbi:MULTISPECIES: hypothetical protein [unclassified Blastomonas]|uniref:hypothetical protein n=1 Tax=unclassified Blastomonas TaxID=2626550 RepID=UPI000825705B|nr:MULTISPECIES: hypothetical protein [unclassified Blastomonas]